MSKFRECEICGAQLDPGEKCDCAEVLALACTQPPVIAENLDSVRQNLEAVVAEVSALPLSDESLKYVKQLRAGITRDFEQLEIQRKAVKKQVMEPYDRAEQKYKEFISGPYRAADAILKGWVDGYQDGLKSRCEESLKEYFDELCTANGIDFLPFSRCGVTVDMAMARQKLPKKAMDQIREYVLSVRKDMDTILKLENADEVMAEYRSFPVLSAAMITVDRRSRERDDANRYVQEQKQRQEQLEQTRAALMAAAPEIEPEPEEQYSVCFRATGTLSALKAMKAHAVALGVTFEELQQEDEQ